MRLRPPALVLLAVLWCPATAIVACGGEPKPSADPTTASATKTPVTDPPTSATVTATAPVAAPAPAKVSMAELQKNAVQGIVAAFNAHDAKKLASFYAADASVRSPSKDGWKEEQGREALEKGHAELFAHVPDVHIATVRVLQKADVVVWEWLATGSDSLGTKGDAPTHASVGFRAASVLWFDGDGQVKIDHTYFDPATIAGQLGKLEKTMKVRPVTKLPSHDETWVESDGSDREAKNVDRVRTFFATFEKNDEKTFLQMVDDKGLHYDFTQPTDEGGPGAEKVEFRTLRKAFPDLKVGIDNVWGIGLTVVAETTTTGTHKGPLGSIKPTHKQVSVHRLALMDLDGSGATLLSRTSYGNSGELMSQITPTH